MSWQKQIESRYRLKPCPFCGEAPALKTDTRYPRPKCKPMTAFEIVCVNYDCIIYNADNVYFRTELGAVRKWNKRAREGAKR